MPSLKLWWFFNFFNFAILISDQFISKENFAVTKEIDSIYGTDRLTTDDSCQLWNRSRFICWSLIHYLDKSKENLQLIHHQKLFDQLDLSHSNASSWNSHDDIHNQSQNKSRRYWRWGRNARKYQRTNSISWVWESIAEGLFAGTVNHLHFPKTMCIGGLQDLISCLWFNKMCCFRHKYKQRCKT